MDAEGSEITSPLTEANMMDMDSSCHFDESSLFMEDEDQELEELNFNETDSREEIKLFNQTFTVSSQLLQDREELDKIFSMETWNSLPSQEKERLKTFLPDFKCPENDELRQNVVEQLLTGENFKFGNPVEDFKEKMWSGKFSTDAVRMSSILMKSKKSQYRARLREQSFKILINVLQTRKKILESITNVPVRTPLSVLRMKRKSCKTSAAHDERIAKRYFRDLSAIRQEKETTEYFSSEDENFPDGPLKPTSSPHEISLLNSDFWQTNVTNGRPVPTFAKPDVSDGLSSTKQRAPRGKRRVGNKAKLEASPPIISSPSGLPVKLPTVPLPQINFDMMNCDQSRSPILLSPNSKFESLLPRVPVSQMSPLAHLLSSPPPSVLMPLSSSPIKQYENNSNDESSLLKTNFQRLPILNIPTPTKPRKQVNDMEVVEEAVANIPGMDLSDVLEDGFNLDFSLEANSVDLGEGAGFLSPGGLSQSVEETSTNGCSCFFALLRDFFLENAGLPMTLAELESRVENWETRGNHNLPWLRIKSSWKTNVWSAVAFLCNFRPDLCPEDFHAYLECCDPIEKVFQWVEMIPDSDAKLQALCKWWLKSEAYFTEAFRREVENFISFNEGNVFRMQEKERMAAPNKFYTYHIGNFSAVVPPIRGAGGAPQGATSGSPKKPHRILVPTRPTYVSTAVIVRDAIARLKTGEGTRQQICELVKQSNYINSDVLSDTKLIVGHVSSALDRLQGEADPCCKHDSARKVWVNLHFGRKEENYETFKPEPIQVKPTNWSQPVQLQPSVVETRSVPTVLEAVSHKDNEIASVVNPVLPTEPLQRTELQKLSQRNMPPPGSSLIQRPVPGQGPMMVQTLQPSTPPKPPVVPKSIVATATAPSYTSPQPAKNVQMIQIMTPQGLKTFKLASPKPVQLAKTSEALQDQVIKPTIMAQSHSPLQIPSMTSKPKEELFRPVPEVTPSRLKLLKPLLGTPPAIQAQHTSPAGQRIVVRDASGKEVHLPPDVLAKLLAAQKKNKTVEPTPISGKELVGGDNSLIQVIQNPVVSTPGTTSQNVQLKARPQVISIQGNVGNFNQQHMQAVQLLSPAGSGVRLLQPAAPRMVNRMAVAPSASPSLVAIGGRQFILTPNQNGPLHQQVVRSLNQQQVVQTVGQQVVVSSASVAPLPPRHVLVHNVGGNRKSVVLSQEQLQQLTNVRFVQGPKRP